MTRSNARQSARKAASFLVEANACARRQLTEAETSSFLHDLESNKSSSFGIVKLSALELDGLTRDDMTLVRHAARLRRSGPVSALLRSGADASAFACTCSDGVQLVTTPGVPCRLRESLPTFAVWLVNQLVQRRRAADGQPCACCANGADTGCRCVLVSLPRCAHALCERCWWLRAVFWDEDEDARGDGLACPLCATSFVDEPAAPDTTFAASHAAWLSLPAVRDTSDAGARKPPFEGVSRPIAAGMYLGISRQQRTDKLHAAAAAGRPLRVASLLRAGCFADARDEYGRTSLFVAAACGRLRTARLLLCFGADGAARDAGSASPASAAAFAGHTQVAAWLRAACAARGDERVEDLCCIEGFHALSVACSPAAAHVVTLIPTASGHAGGGAAFADGCCDESFLSRLEALFASLPLSQPCAPTASDRAAFADSIGWVRAGLEGALRRGKSALVAQGRDDVDGTSGHAFDVVVTAAPVMRFLRYARSGGRLAPHTDLSRAVPPRGKSTHTFVLFLSTSPPGGGGETRLLRCASAAATAAAAGGGGCASNVWAAVAPVRGRLLLFPHMCPHDGAPVVVPPKLLLRGEMA